jgi:hypothetical protein
MHLPLTARCSQTRWITSCSEQVKVIIRWSSPTVPITAPAFTSKMGRTPCTSIIKLLAPINSDTQQIGVPVGAVGSIMMPKTPTQPLNHKPGLGPPLKVGAGTTSRCNTGARKLVLATTFKKEMFMAASCHNDGGLISLSTALSTNMGESYPYEC